MQSWSATVTTLVVYENWHGMSAGMDEAGYDDWLKMVGFVYFVVLFCTMVILCLFLQHGDIHISFCCMFPCLNW